MSHKKIGYGSVPWIHTALVSIKIGDLLTSKATTSFLWRTLLDEICSFFLLLLIESEQGVGRGTNPVHTGPRRVNRVRSSENENRMCIRKSVHCICRKVSLKNILLFQVRTQKNLAHFCRERVEEHSATWIIRKWTRVEGGVVPPVPTWAVQGPRPCQTRGTCFTPWGLCGLHLKTHRRIQQTLVIFPLGESHPGKKTTAVLGWVDILYNSVS
jgi:hypothetical protein